MFHRHALALAAMLLAASPAAAQQLRFSGGIYLFEYAPILRGASDKLEIYAFVLNADDATADGRYGLHVQARARDTKLRPYFNSTVWFQEAYAFAKTPAGELRAGKVYRKVGLFWDDSFFGNVQYFNGLKLNPDYGVEMAGSDWSVQYLTNNDHVAGSLDGRDVESDPDAKLHGLATARYAPTLSLGNAKLTLGASGADGRIARTNDSFRFSQAALDATLARGPITTYAEVLRQNGQRAPATRLGYATATYFLAGARWQATQRVLARVNVSRATYQQLGHEIEWVPGVVIALAKNVSLINEFDYWKNQAAVIDRSFDFVVNYRF